LKSKENEKGSLAFESTKKNKVKMKNIKYTTIVGGNRVEILKKYRTRTQFEYYLTIFMGDSDYESILIYQELHLTRKEAYKEAERAITSKRQPKIERVIYVQKKIARPINKAKNLFVKWLKENNATDIDIFEGEPSKEWDYYRMISGFIGSNLINADFQMWCGRIKINYSDDENEYRDMTVDEFTQMIE